MGGISPDGKVMRKSGRHDHVSRNSRELGDLNGLADAVAAVPYARLEVCWLGDEPESDPERELIRGYAPRLPCCCAPVTPGPWWRPPGARWKAR